MTLQLVVNTGNIQIMTVASLEDRILRMLVDVERDYMKWIARRTPRGHEEYVFASYETLPRTLDVLPKPEQCSSGFPHEYNAAIAAVADYATKVLENFPRERSKLLSLLPRELGWRSWSNDDEVWTRSAT